MDTLQGLTQLNQVPVDMTLEGLRAIGQRQRTDEITLQELARKQQYEQQADPLRIRQMQLANDVSLQNLGRMTRENKEGDFTSDARMQAELKKHLLNASQADLDQVAQHGQRLAYSQNPKERAIGQALLLQSKEAIIARQAQEAHLRAVQAQQAGALARANAKPGKSFDPKNPEHMYAHLMNRALTAESEEEAAHFRGLADEQLSVMREKWQTKAVPPGTVDVGAAGRRPVPTLPTPAPVSVAGPTNAATAGRPARQAAAEAAKKNPTNIQEAQQAGWVYKVDAKGNKAYVSPDNKQFIEVK